MYKLEMHLHTLGCSPCARTDEKTIAELYAAKNYNGIVCTNHFNRYLCDEYYKKGSQKDNVEYWLNGYRTLKKECTPYGIDVFLGLELLIDSLTYYKPEPPYAETLIYGIDETWLLAHTYDLFGMEMPQLYDLCRENGWILSQAHPFRTGINVQNPAYLEGAEAWNGNPTATNHNDLAMNFVKTNALLPTAGSDFHSVGDEGCGVYLENAVHDNAELVAELRKRRHKLFNQNGTIEF
ncbi:MAG: hypothetical protein MRZ13_04040 [Clostridiales bacterium]|nr:hypothetical protein [Clostridiales bacterium]MDY4895068.1 hypothetical protein [Christensenellaceae bacterium]